MNIKGSHNINMCVFIYFCSWESAIVYIRTFSDLSLKMWQNATWSEVWHFGCNKRTYFSGFPVLKVDLPTPVSVWLTSPVPSFPVRFMRLLSSFCPTVDPFPCDLIQSKLKGKLSLSICWIKFYKCQWLVQPRFILSFVTDCEAWKSVCKKNPPLLSALTHPVW